MFQSSATSIIECRNTILFSKLKNLKHSFSLHCQYVISELLYAWIWFVVAIVLMIPNINYCRKNCYICEVFFFLLFLWILLKILVKCSLVIVRLHRPKPKIRFKLSMARQCTTSSPTLKMKNAITEGLEKLWSAFIITEWNEFCCEFMVNQLA